MHFRMRLTVLCIIFSFTSVADAWPRFPYEDYDVADRSELIVVGALKKGSARWISTTASPSSGQSWEYHAVLSVNEVLKGKSKESELPIIIYYGLSLTGDGHLLDNQDHSDENTKGPLRVEDTGGGDMGGNPILEDARQNNLWFLRRRSGKHGREPGTGDFGVVDPQDIKPISLKTYTRCLLAPDAESAVRRQLAQQPEIAARALRFLDHCELQRIIKIPDPAQRVERLIPYYLMESTCEEATKGMIASGSVAGPYLFGVYTRTRDDNLRNHIIPLWGEIRWTGCTDFLISRLFELDKYWAEQKLAPGWWNDTSDLRTRELRQNMYSQTYYSVYTLGQLADSRAKEAIEVTRKRWISLHFDNPQTVEECDAALKKFRDQDSQK